jgi:hypothetical protein
MGGLRSETEEMGRIASADGGGNGVLAKSGLE